MQLKTNLDDTTFEINDQADRSVINISKDGMVKSSDMLGTSLIIASSVSGDQKLDIPIEVKNINYIMASAIPNVQMKGLERHLPKDLNFDMTISLHDNLGNKFSHNFEELKWQLSNRDLVEVSIGENFTLNVKLLRQGTNMLAVSLRDSTGIKYHEDYIKLSVKAENGIFNEGFIATLGDIICFNSPLNNAYQWITSSDALNLQGSVGRIVSIPSSQKISILHGPGDNSYISYDIQVRSPDRIQFNKKFDIFNGETYHGQFVISNHQQTDKLSNIIATNGSSCDELKSNYSADFISCKIICDDYTVSKKFEVSANFDGRFYSCEIQPLSSLEEITSYARGKDIRMMLEARLMPSGIFDRIELRLSPAIQITPKSISIDKLSQNEIIISGIESILQKVEVHSSHPENLVLFPSSSKTVGRLQFRSKLNNPEKVDSELFIKVYSPLTQQTVQIPIVPPSVEEIDNSDNGWLILFLTNTGKVIASTVLALTIVGLFFMFFRNRDLDSSGGE